MHSMFPLQGNNAFNVLSIPRGSSLPEDHPGANGRRYFTIQRINGTGAQGSGLGCGHQHTLEDSDRVKKNSVQRILLKEDKERKKSVVRFSLLILLEAHPCMGKTGVRMASPQELLTLTSRSRSAVSCWLHRHLHKDWKFVLSRFLILISRLFRRSSNGLGRTGTCPNRSPITPRRQARPPSRRLNIRQSQG